MKKFTLGEIEELRIQIETAINDSDNSYEYDGENEVAVLSPYNASFDVVNLLKEKGIIKTNR